MCDEGSSSKPRTRQWTGALGGIETQLKAAEESHKPTQELLAQRSRLKKAH